MNRLDLFNKLKFLFDDKNEIGLNMYMIMKTDEDFLIRKADLDQPVIDELKRKYRAKINLQCNIDSDLGFSEITQANDRRSTIYHYNLKEKPQGLKVLDTILKTEQDKLFNFSKDNFKSIYGFVFLIGNADKNIALYKKMYPISLIQRDSVLMVHKVKTRLVRLDEDILKINDDFDFIQIEDDLIITNINTLERYFGYEDIIRRQADANLQLIEESGLLEDILPLKEMALEIKYAKKIVKLKRGSPVLTLQFDRVKKFVKNHPKLKNRMRFNTDGTKFSLDTKTSKELFLKLLDDDFLKSELTDLLYESEVKDQLSNEEEQD